VNAAPDGYTLLLATVPNAVNASLYEKLKFDFLRDIAPVAGIIRVPMVILLNPSVPAGTVPEFIAYAKPIRARSAWRRPAMAARRTWPASCSR